MLIAHGGGWGAQSWGGSGWGGSTALAASSAFSFRGAFAPSENIIRMLFTQLPYFSEIYDTYDASDVAHYSVAAVSTTTGLDGYAARTVDPVQVIIAPVPNAIDVYLDRPLSPYPTQYVFSYANLASSGLTTILAPGQVTLFGCYRKLQPQHEDVVLPTTDLANPQTITAVQGSALASTIAPGALTLGVFQVDSSGDYAFDAGIQVLKKRILRRGITDKGAFAHLPASYGVGLLSACKKLSRPSSRDKYAADYATQIMQEPEVVSATVTALQDPAYPALVHFLINVRTRTGTSFSMDHPMNTITGVSLASAGA